MPLSQLNEIIKPTIKDTALVKLPKWIFGLTIGRVINKKDEDDEDVDAEEDERAAESDSSSGPGKHTPSSGDDDFELLDKSLEDISTATTPGSGKTTGIQAQSGKNNKRKGKGKKK